MKAKSKRGMRDVLAYGIGGVGENISYNLFYMFFIFFLTSVAGISPAAAGTISLIAVAWDAISDPIVGYLSDRCRGWKGFGKRGTFILLGAIPLGISVFLLYNDVALSGAGKVAYFVIINMLFWMVFTIVDIPYVSVATEITEDYDIKTKMRTSTMLFSNLGQLILSFGILQFADFMAENGYSDTFVWRIIGAVMGFLSAFTFLIVAVSMRGKELESAAAEPAEKLAGGGGQKGSMIRDYIDFLKMHDYRMLLIMGLGYNIFVGMSDSALLYYQMYTCGLTMSQTSIVETVALFVSLALIVPVGEVIVKIGKKQTMLIAFVYMLFYAGICGFTRPSMVILAFLDMGIMVTSSVFWINIYAMNFDVAAIYDYKYEKNREGMMISICSFMTKIGVAVGMWLNGMLMSALGVDPEAEVITEEMASALQTIFGKVPAVLAVIMALACIFYRVKKEHILALEEARELKAEGKEYSIDGFKDVL